MSGTELLREAVRRSLDRSSYTTIVQSWVDGDLFISSVSHVGELAAYSEAQWFGTTSVRRWTVGNVHLVDVNDSGWIRSLEPLGRTTVDQLQDNTLLTELAMLEGTEVRRRDGTVVIELICPADVDPGDLQLCDPRAESTVLITVDLATGFIVEQWIEGLSPISPGDWRPTVNQVEIGPLEWTEKELLAQPDDYDRSAYTCLADLLGVDATDEHAMQAAIEFTTTAENQATFGACGLRFYPPGPDLVERDPD